MTTKKETINVGTRVEFWHEGTRYRGSIVKLKLSKFDVIEWVEVKAEEQMTENQESFTPFAGAIDIFAIGIFDKTLEVC